MSPATWTVRASFLWPIHRLCHAQLATIAGVCVCQVGKYVQGQPYTRRWAASVGAYALRKVAVRG